MPNTDTFFGPRGANGAVRWLIITGVALGCFGCALDSSRKINFTATPLPPVRAQVLANTVTVMPLSDERPTAFERGPELLLLLPFVPSINSYWERPDQDLPVDEETKKKWDAHLPEDLAKGLAQALESRKLFQAVAYSQSAGDGHLILTGKLTSTRMDVTNTTYGLGIAVLPVAFLGAPGQYFTWHLAFKLELQEPLTQTVLWHNAYRSEREVKNSNFYYREELSPRYWTSYLLMDLIPTIIGDLEKALTAIKTGATSAEAVR